MIDVYCHIATYRSRTQAYGITPTYVLSSGANSAALIRERDIVAWSSSRYRRYLQQLVELAVCFRAAITTLDCAPSAPLFLAHILQYFRNLPLSPENE
jgi:hypothetical protein